MSEIINRVGEKNVNYQGCPMEIIECQGTKNNTIRFSCGTIVNKKEYKAFKQGSIKNPKFHVGEVHKMNDGEEIKIIDISGAKDCKIIYSDGTVKEHVCYNDIIKGLVAKPYILGAKRYNNQGCEMELMEIINGKNCTIKFTIDDYVIKNVTYYRFNKGEVKHPYHPSVYGVGYLGIYNYIKVDPIIRGKWSNMMDRCYSKLQESRSPSYLGARVCKEWHNFENFVEWFKKSYNPETMSGFHLDKDVLIKNNKIYSPGTCEFVPADINFCFVKADKSRGDLPIGVTKSHNKFTGAVSCGNIRTQERFDTSTEAFLFYKEHKEICIKELANKWRGQITERCYESMMNRIVEITD